MEDGGGIIGMLFTLIWLVVCVFLIVSMWKVYVKAGKPGWASLIPIYNLWVLLEICGKPGWWIILFFIPIANVVCLILVCLGLAEKFGKSAGFGLGIAFLGIVFLPLLAFSDAEYQGQHPVRSGRYQNYMDRGNRMVTPVLFGFERFDESRNDKTICRRAC